MELAATLVATGTDTVVFTFTVTNRSDTDVQLTFPSSQRGDVRVMADDSEETVWQWSDGRMFAQALEDETIGPDGDLELIFEWDDPSPGRYRATATLAADREPAASTRFTV